MARGLKKVTIYQIIKKSIHKRESIPKERKGVLWINLVQNKTDLTTWLQKNLKIDPLSAHTLAKPQSHVRIMRENDEIFMVLRELSLNTKKNPEETHTITFWIKKNIIVTISTEKSQAIDHLQELLEKKKIFPNTSGELLTQMIKWIVENLGNYVEQMEDDLEEVEEILIRKKRKDISRSIANTRRKSLIIYRHMTAQTQTLHELTDKKHNWLTTKQKKQIREYFHTMDHAVNTLQNTQARAVVVQDELNAKADQQLNQQNYILSVVAALFLPITFITGLLGMNVAGIPYAQHAHSFWVITGITITLFFVILLALKKRDWL